MSDINELLHAISLAEKLAEGVAFEIHQAPTENLIRVREHLASARIRATDFAAADDANLINDHAVLDDRLRRAMTAIAKAKGVEIVEDPYVRLDETEIEFGDGRTIRMKATEDDVRTIMSEFEKANAKEVESLSDRLKRANLKLAEAKLAARQCEGFEPELRYLFATDPEIRARVRAMAEARTKAA